MRTLVREGAWVFIVVGVDPFSLEQKSFPYRSLLGRILRDPFHIGIPLRFLKTWRASHVLIQANVVNKHSLTNVVSLHYAFSLDPVNFRIPLAMIPSALGCPLGDSLYNSRPSTVIKWGLTAQSIPSLINRRLIFCDQSLLSLSNKNIKKLLIVMFMFIC